MTKIILPAVSVASKLILPGQPVVTSLILPVDVKTVSQAANASLEAYKLSIVNAFAQRIEHERKNAKDARICENFVNTLENNRDDMLHDAIASVLLAAKYNPADICVISRGTQMMYQKAIPKITNIARCLSSVATLNHFTNALLQTVQSFDAAGLQMLQSDASAACSASGKLPDAKHNKLLVRTKDHFSPGTSGVQATSSSIALRSFNIIRETRDASNKICFTLNKDNAATEQLLARCY